MQRNFRHFLRLLGQSVLFWTFAMFCYSMFRYYGVDQELAFSIREGFEGNRLLIEPIVVLSSLGFGLGVVYAIVDSLFDRFMPKKIALGFNFLLKTFLHFVATIFAVTMVISIVSTFIETNVEIKPGWLFFEKRFWSALFYIVLCSFILSFIKIASQRFGRGVFLKILIGTYTNPKEEERIFMFLDLKDSTPIAEDLGHHLYSQFIQDCFLDLNEVVLKYDAEIYQYVGDEAVLNWPYKKGLANNNCIGVFFAFQQQRFSRKEYYLEKYGVYPEFKAGLHGGPLMVAEVGSVKKELAYHGDVINTSARIQAECNTHNVTLLLSEKLLKDLGVDQFSTTKSLGSILLKGKKQEVRIHTIQHI